MTKTWRDVNKCVKTYPALLRFVNNTKGQNTWSKNMRLNQALDISTIVAITRVLRLLEISTTGREMPKMVHIRPLLTSRHCIMCSVLQQIVLKGILAV